MENKAIARTLRLLSQLMELHEVNSFKVKSIANASFKVDKLPFVIKGKTLAELEKIEGIGKSTASKIVELLETGTMTELEEMLAVTPLGVVEMMSIKGIGPKKVAVIWRELAIDNVGELFYACNENRLIEAKGFGLKTQEEIRKAIEFKILSNGKYLFARAEPIAHQLVKQLQTLIPGSIISLCGDLRRKCEVISELCLVVSTLFDEDPSDVIISSGLLMEAVKTGKTLSGELENGLRVLIHFAEKANFFKEVFIRTGSDQHVQLMLNRISDDSWVPDTEAAVYQKAGLQYIEPELRDSVDMVEKAASNLLPQLINYNDLRGALHNHSTWSDGVHSLEEMAIYCRDHLKLEYLGICDHSKSAFYAKGLSIERVLQQQEEIDHLNKKVTGFTIFKGIECDILNDGALDYPDEILQRFDFIVASVHSNLKMNEEKATTRLVKAIENPYTTMLGHPTGRLLLSRNGYPIDYKKVIDACAANSVVIEINANPFRLDMDWRWHQYALEKGVWLSINPDAHRNEGFLDMHYGIYVARKGGLFKERCLNALSVTDIAAFFKNRKIEKLS
jgi:DNA polymerase (family 10)